MPPGRARARPTPAGADGNRCPGALPFVGLSDADAAASGERSPTEEVAAEEVVERAAASAAEQALQRRAGVTLLAGEAAVVDIAQLHGAALTIADDLSANGRGPDPAYIAGAVCHPGSPSSAECRDPTQKVNDSSCSANLCCPPCWHPIQSSLS